MIYNDDDLWIYTEIDQWSYYSHSQNVNKFGVQKLFLFIVVSRGKWEFDKPRDFLNFSYRNPT